jgi:hypothetical protein
MMPLIKSKSKNAFEHNLKAEIHAGKPMKQSLAIAYATKRRAKKSQGGIIGADKMKSEAGIKPGMAPKFAKGGQIQPEKPKHLSDAQLMPGSVNGAEQGEAQEHIEEHLKAGSSDTCPDCMAQGGMCMAHGGQIPFEMQSQDLEQLHQSSSDSDVPSLEESFMEGRGPSSEGGREHREFQTKDEPPASYSQDHSDADDDLNMIRDIFRRKLAMGGRAEPLESISEGPLEDAYEPTDDFSTHGLVEDSEHDSGDSLELNDQSIVGQIFNKKRKRS